MSMPDGTMGKDLASSPRAARVAQLLPLAKSPDRLPPSPSHHTPPGMVSASRDSADPQPGTAAAAELGPSDSADAVVPTARSAASTTPLRPIPITLSDEELLAIDEDVEEEFEDGVVPATLLMAAPPWLISLVVHMLGLVLLGILFIPGLVRKDIELRAIFGETLGEQLEDASVEFATVDPAEHRIVTMQDLTTADDPLAAPPDVKLPLGGNLLASSDSSTPQVGLALTGRETGMQQALLLAYGGNATTETAVSLGLKWLAKNQRRDGSWSLKGPYQDGAGFENVAAATAMALLAFQGAGFTHQSSRPFMDSQGNKQHVDYKRVVTRGWEAMLKSQDVDGNFWRKGEVAIMQHRLYSHAQATIAICELYGMTQDPKFRRPAQKAVDYAVAIQDALGGWRYEPGVDSDTSVTGWFVMALQSARMAGLDVPSDVFEKVSRFLDQVTDDGGSRYSYLPGEGSKPSMTAEALLCRQYLGWRRDDERLQTGIRYLENYPIDWAEPNSYYWYYATQVMHHMEGDAWDRWNRVMRQEIPANQVMKDKERGSWSPDGDRWAGQAGRLYMTSLCIYMLEVYYRHLPIYSKVYESFER